MDISYKINTDGTKRRFNYRVAAILEHEGKLLIHKPVGMDYTYIPGGRVQIGESSEDAVKRELREELDISLNIVGVPYVVENFFEYDGEIYHELSFFFKVTTQDTQNLPKEGEIRDNVAFFWRDADDIEDLNLKPEFLAAAFKEMPTTTKHIINYGNNLK